MANEFRQDPLSGDWVLIAPGRGKRPNSREKIPFPVHECPFDGLHNFVEIIPNKYPAVAQGQCGPIIEQGIYSVAAGVGVHELVITRDHDRQYFDFTDQEMSEVIKVYRDRYRELAKDDCNKYISIFHNHGVLAGASIYHNHSQILTVPIIPPKIQEMIDRRPNGRLVESEKIRIISQNDSFVAFCPFVSRSPYEINIFPKQAQSDFAQLSDENIPALGSIMREIFIRLNKALGDPDYTYFIHTVPPQTKSSVFDWHIEIMPRFSPAAGFEFGTDIFINTVDPDQAADELRDVAI